jgi:hypothetical protein
VPDKLSKPEVLGASVGIGTTDKLIFPDEGFATVVPAPAPNASHRTRYSAPQAHDGAEVKVAHARRRPLASTVSSG